jgi:LacI family transcriptional regulator
VPEEIAIAGFDDIPLCEMISPTLSTVRQDRALRAKIAIEKLRELKSGKSVNEEIKLPVQLVIRDSTGR